MLTALFDVRHLRHPRVVKCAKQAAIGFLVAEAVPLVIGLFGLLTGL